MLFTILIVSSFAEFLDHHLNNPAIKLFALVRIIHLLIIMGENSLHLL